MGNALVIENGHAKRGPLPRWAIERPKGAYFGYFENEFGEQWVFVAHQGLLRLAGGMHGWSTVMELRPDADELDRLEACADALWPEGVPMNRDERLWLMACVASAAAVEKARLEAAR